MKTIKKIVRKIVDAYVEAVELEYRPYFNGR
jgi:hypothetical protein